MKASFSTEEIKFVNNAEGLKIKSLWESQFKVNSENG